MVFDKPLKRFDLMAVLGLDEVKHRSLVGLEVFGNELEEDGRHGVDREDISNIVWIVDV